MARLGEIPHKHKLIPIHGATKVSDYADLIEHDPKYKNKVILNGYTAALNLVFNKLLDNFSPMTVIKIVCEQQEYYSDLANQLFRAFSMSLAEYHPMITGMEFIMKNTSVMTQPADYLAFAIGKYLDERGTKKDLWCRPIFGDFDPDKLPGHTFSKVEARLAVGVVRMNIQLQLRGVLPPGTIIVPKKKK